MSDVLETEAVQRALGESVDRLSAAAALLERVIVRLDERHAAVSGDVPRVVAAVDLPLEAVIGPTRRETELERRLEEAEGQIAELRASRAVPVRKTLPAAASHLLAKHGLADIETIQAGALDAALVGLSLEQRIAVKAQLLRAGALV